ncbi:hypothetical protein Ddye_030895 [Dipteronia dyeriana]|uniref:Uncharacterized protein n=1 Tax=Dipteronia dyeriana TaxID=168575 RepID=A0AAD9THV0_9ROSI|nr:hypothetical protein Ddye_030895 [Dipteronia dyeriana]
MRIQHLPPRILKLQQQNQLPPRICRRFLPPRMHTRCLPPRIRRLHEEDKLDKAAHQTELFRSHQQFESLHAQVEHLTRLLNLQLQISWTQEASIQELLMMHHMSKSSEDYSNKSDSISISNMDYSKLLDGEIMRTQQIPPRMLKLQQQCLPPRMRKLQEDQQPSLRMRRRRCLPPRMRKLQEDQKLAKAEPQAELLISRQQFESLHARVERLTRLLNIQLQISWIQEAYIQELLMMRRQQQEQQLQQNKSDSVDYPKLIKLLDILLINSMEI